MAEVYGVITQKGGVGKTALSFNLGTGLVREGKRVLLLDLDPQCTLTKICGLRTPEDIPVALHDVILKQLNGEVISPVDGIYTEHKEGVHILPSRQELTELEDMLRNIDEGPLALKKYVDTVKADYDYVIIDSGPTLATLSINVMAAADKLIIPIQPYYEPVAGMEQLLETYFFVRNSGLNPNLQIKGMVFTMVESRVNFSKDIMDLVQSEYGEHINILKTKIPRSSKVPELSAQGKSVFRRSTSKVAMAYENLTKEVMGIVREHEREAAIEGPRRDIRSR